MRTVIQRVTEASVAVPAKDYVSSIGQGLLVLAAFIDEDTEDDLSWTARKIAAMRIFDDADGVMNLSVKDVDGDIIAVSQFTLYANCKKGFRPSFLDAGDPAHAEALYDYIVTECRNREFEVETGSFGADMKVSLVNDGPFTIVLDSREL
jgi:D-tyrosyl-tRNA(Tyr) deacylase